MYITNKSDFLILGQKARYHLEQLASWIVVAIAVVIPISTGLTSVLIPVAAVLSICIGRWRERFFPLVNNPVALLFCAFFCLFLIGSLYSSATNTEVIQMLVKYSKFLLAVFLIPLFIDRRRQSYAIYAFLAAMLITLILSYLKIMGIFHFDTKYSSSAVFKNHIDTNFLMSMAAYLVAHKMLTYKRFRFLWILLLILLVVNILFLSTGRSGYVVFFVLLTLFLWQQFKWRGCLLALLGISILSISAYTLSPQFKTRIIAVQQNIIQYYEGDEVTSVGLRISFAKNSFLLFKQSPLWGTGTGSFVTEYNKFISNTEPRGKNPHNEYLNILTQLGLVGFILLLCLFYIPWRQSYMLPPSLRILVQGIIAAIAIGSLANSWLMDTTEGNLFVYFLALAFAQYHYNPGRTAQGNHLDGKAKEEGSSSGQSDLKTA